MFRSNTLPAVASLPAPPTPSLASALYNHDEILNRDGYVQLSNLGASSASASSQPPTLRQLADLTSLPASMVRRSGRARRTPGRLVREGEIVAKFFNEAASRPIPRNGLSLEQTVTSEATSYGTFLTTSTTVPVYASMAFALTSFGVAFSPLNAAFDQYRFEQIECWIEPTTSATTAFINEVVSAVDLDDANVPPTFISVSNKPGALVGTGASGRYHKWKPHMAIAAYSGAFTSYSNVEPTWIDSSSPSVQHFGIKMGSSPASIAIIYNITFRAVVSFRAPSAD